MASKSLVLVVDTSSLFAPHFGDLVNHYLLPLLSRIFMLEQNQTSQFQGNVELALVLFRDLVPNSDFLVRSTSFSSDLKEIRWALNNMQFGPTSPTVYRPVVEALCTATKVKFNNASEY